MSYDGGVNDNNFAPILVLLSLPGLSKSIQKKIVKKFGVSSASLELGPSFLESDPDYNVSKTFARPAKVTNNSCEIWIRLYRKYA